MATDDITLEEAWPITIPMRCTSPSPGLHLVQGVEAWAWYGVQPITALITRHADLPRRAARNATHVSSQETRTAGLARDPSYSGFGLQRHTLTCDLARCQSLPELFSWNRATMISLTPILPLKHLRSASLRSSPRDGRPDQGTPRTFLICYAGGEGESMGHLPGIAGHPCTTLTKMLRISAGRNLPSEVHTRTCGRW